MKWNHEHFTGVDWDQRTKTNGVYRIVSRRHKGWSRYVDKENGNYDYLLGCDVRMDSPISELRTQLFVQIDHTQPDVREGGVHAELIVVYLIRSEGLVLPPVVLLSPVKGPRYKSFAWEQSQRVDRSLRFHITAPIVTQARGRRVGTWPLQACTYIILVSFRDGEQGAR